MTALTVPAQPAQDAGLRPVPWRRMGWVTWRQHRPTLISVPAVFGAVALFLLVEGLRIHHDYAVLTAACQRPNSDACQNLNSAFDGTDWTVANTMLILLNIAPALVGAFAGAPVLARELESGTYRYAWTQGIGRQRWTIAKLVLLAAVVTATAGAFSQVFAWFFRPFITQEDMNVLTATVFDTHGIAFAAWTLAAFTIGALAGMLIRRIVPAMAATLGVYAGLGIVTWLFLRPRYLPAVVSSSSPAAGPPGISGRSPWILSTWITGPGGRPVSQATIDRFFQRASNPDTDPWETLARHGYLQWTRYIPVSRFWPMQFIEAGWLLVLSVLLIAATVRLVRRRAA